MRQTITVLFLLLFINIEVWTQQKWDRPMQLKSCRIDIKSDMFTASTFIEMEFYNPNNQEIEGLHRFELKPGQVITGFQLDLNGRYRDGSIEEKWKATNAYNSIVGKRIDPALLTMEYADHYSLRIYPVPAKGSRKVTMTIQQLLTAEKNGYLYSLPLNSNDTVQHFMLNISVNGNLYPAARPGLIAGHGFTTKDQQHDLEWNTESILLKGPIAFSIPVSSQPIFCTKKVEQKTHFALRFWPSWPAEYEIHPKEIVVFWDASASSANRDVNREINFLKQFISYHNVSKLTVIPFNYKLLDTAVFHTENNFKSRWQQYLQNMSYDGSTQLGIIDLSVQKADIFLLFSDGNNTYGKSKPKTGTTPVYCVHTSNTANITSLRQISGASGGKVIDLTKSSMSTALSVSSRVDNWLINISSASGKTITEQSLPLKQEGSLFINGTMDGRSDTLYFHYGTNAGLNRVEKIVIDAGMQCPGSAIDRLSMLNNFDYITRQYSWSNIIDFGLKEKVVTPHTAYIVLERTEDYVKYNITPPKELETECEKMNYVKRDTRFERMKLAETDEFTIVSNVVKVYNQRISQWDVNAKQISLNRMEYDKFNYKAAAETVSATTIPSTGNTELIGKAAGPGIQSNALEEVIVTGYGTARKSLLTGSVAYIRSHDIFSSVNTVEQALQGRVAGLHVTNSSGAPGSAANITMRGFSSLGANNQPLYILDGLPISGNINDIINVHDIDNITVLKDISASSLYGSRAANGAIIINSKKGKNYYNYYTSKPYRLKDMEDVAYLQELKDISLSEKMLTYQKLKEQYGGEAGFYFDAAQHFFEIGLRKEAIEILMNATEAANGSQQVLVATAYILEYWTLFEEAIYIYEQLIKDNADKVSFYRNLAWANYQSGNWQRAVDILYGAIKMNTGQQEAANLSEKAIIMNEMNAIIAMHKSRLDISAIPQELIKPLPVDMRITLDCNAGSVGNVSIREPGGVTCSYLKLVTKNGGTIQNGYYWYNGNPVEYQIRNAPQGKYKISVNYYGHYSNNSKIPSVIRVMKFKNFGKENQSVEIENVMMDNQYGEVEIAEVKW
jgi:TonB-dependent SusC/RagA subfamily outer membrane receptor